MHYRTRTRYGTTRHHMSLRAAEQAVRAERRDGWPTPDVEPTTEHSRALMARREVLR